MKKENTFLKKEFKKNDVSRMRNIITGRLHDKIEVGSGYEKEEVIRAEGEVWEEDGRKWKLENGIKTNISKLQKAREVSVFPVFCPKCETVMDKKQDKDFYDFHKHCLDCQIKFETQLKGKGLWKDYQNQIINNTIDGLIDKYKNWVNDLIQENSQGFVTEAGDLERWSGTNTKSLLENTDQLIKFLEGMKK